MLRLEGFDSVKVGEKLELPDISELLIFPFVGQVHLEDLRRNAPESLKYLIDRVQLRNDRKYVTVNMNVQLLSPNVTSAPRSNWHFDSSSVREEDTTYIHILSSECGAVTEFIKDDIHLPEFDEDVRVSELEVYMNRNLHLIHRAGIVPIECGRFHTFNGGRHVHRATRAKAPEFRFFMRVMESNEVEGVSFESGLMDRSRVFNDGIMDYSKIDEKYIRENVSKVYDSIVKNANGTINLFYN
jgi:hypothetical protein